MKRFILSSLCIASTIICGQMTVFAGLDTILQRAGESLRPKETSQALFNNSMKLGNIYSQSYSLAKQSFTTSVSQTLVAMTTDFNTEYNCNLGINDMGALLNGVDDVRNQMLAALSVTANQRESFLSSLSNDYSFGSSCVRMDTCMQKAKGVAPSSFSLKPTLTDTANQNCQNYIKGSFNNHLGSISSIVDLSDTSVGSDIYYNGTLDDSPYDILVDIQRIGDILFANNEQSSKTLFFTFPTSSIAGFQAIPFDASSNYTNQPTTLNLFTPTSTPNNTINPSTTTNSQSSNNTNTLQGSLTTSNSNTSNPNGGLSSNSSSNQSTPTPQLSSSNPTIQNYVCIAPTTDTNTTTEGPATNGGENRSDNGSQTTGSNNTNSPSQPSNSQSGGSLPPTPTINPNTPYYSPIVQSSDDPMLANANWESPDEFKAQEASIRSCINNCGSLPAIDKAMCIAKCTCGSAGTKDGIFSLQVCTVPSKQYDIVSSKSVQSIEEILTAINGSLLALKESGEMMKHSRTKEFLDTSLSNIKLNQIFAFDFNIAMKPVIATKPRKMTDAEVEARKDQEMAGNYTSIDIGKEKNKYLVLYNPTLEDAKNRGFTSADELRKVTDAINAQQESIKTLDKSVTDGLAKSQNAELNDIVKQFIEQNIRFRSYVNESLTNIKGTADSINQKIKKGN